MTLDLQYLANNYSVKVNGFPYTGTLIVGDTLDVNNIVYIVQTLNEDGILVRRLFEN